MRYPGATVNGMVVPSASADFLSHSSTQTSESTNEFKIWAIVCIIFISVFGGFAPLWLHCISEELRCRVTNFSKFFASGVFLGVGLLHMLPEAAQGLEELGWGEGTGKLPVAFAVSAMGFVLVWFIERVSHSRSASFGGKGRIMAAAAQAEKMGGGSLCYVQVETVSSYGPLVCKPVAIVTPSGDSNRGIPVQWSVPGDSNRADLPPTPTFIVLPAESGQTQTNFFSHLENKSSHHEPLLSRAPLAPPPSKRVSQDYYQHGCKAGGAGGVGGRGPLPVSACSGEDGGRLKSCQDLTVSPQCGPTSSSPNLHSPHHHHHLSPPCKLEGHHPNPPPSSMNPDMRHDPSPHPTHTHPADDDHSHSWGPWAGVEGGSSGDVCEALHEHKHDAKHHHLMLPGGGGVSYLLAGLFSLHSFVVGAALGTENSVNGAASLLIAIAAHKGAEAFAVGVEFVREKVPLGKTVGILLVYCTMTPLGILTGMLAQLVQGPTGALITNFTQAFGSGTVLYIVMHLLGTDNGDENKVGILELLLVLCGLSIMAAVSMYS